MCLGHSKMTYLLCPSDPDDDRRRGADFNQTVAYFKSVGPSPAFAHKSNFGGLRGPNLIVPV